MDVVAGLDAFRGVARKGSFTGAAESLGLPQPVVSRRVAALETELGVTLFERNSRSVMITDAGSRILPRADDVLDQIARIRRLASEEQAELIMAVPPGIDPKALAAIRRAATQPVVFAEGPPRQRSEQWSNGSVAAALVPGDEEASDISVPLGVAGVALSGHRFSFRQLLRTRAERVDQPRVLQVGVEDDRPAVGDPLRRAAWSAGWRQDQLQFGIGVSEALVRAHERGDLVLMTRREAGAAGLDWLPAQGMDLVRELRLVHTPDFCGVDQRELLVQRLTRGLVA
ncbi:LysR family transcriptional regulator [Propionibacteriaceae bacterium Y1685]